MKVVDRATHLLVAPQAEWDVISHERTDVQSLYLNYIAILAALPAAATFISTALVGTLAAGRLDPMDAVGATLTGYVLSLIMVYVVALAADALAPRFGGRKNMDEALKLTAYALTASWVAGLFTFLPVLAWLITLLGGLYSLYLFQVGAPALMKVPDHKAAGYTVAVVAIAIVLSFLVGALIATWFGMSAIGMLGAIGRF